MPYITKFKRQELDSNWQAKPESPGELTYCLQQMLRWYLECSGLTYAHLAECLGALEGAKIDLTERVIKPYEAKKLAENGDVWPWDLTHPRQERPA
jgi:hypothetical protein